MFTSDTCLSRDNELPFLGSSENSESPNNNNHVELAHAQLVGEVAKKIARASRTVLLISAAFEHCALRIA